MADLRLEHIYKVYPNGTKAVSDFTMDIKDQEFIVFVGPSGCGKSTTLRMIAGLEEISAGELYIDDHIVNDVEPKDRDIAMVFQNYALYPHMTVYENIAFSLKLRHVPNEEIHKKVLWAAQILGLTEYLDRKPKAMSGGQRQRVALGRAIIRNPKVMLLDEPLSNLDAKLRAQMRSEIANLHQKLKTTIIYVTHDQVEAMTLGTRVVVMKLGKIMQIDTPKNLYDYPANKFVAGFIGTPQMNFFNAAIERNGLKDKILINNYEKPLNVSHTQLSKVQPKYFTSNSKVIIGIRCEHLSLEKEIVSKSDTKIKIKITNFEELGNETLIYGELLSAKDNIKKPQNIVVRGNSTYGYRLGDTAEVAIDMTKVHLFDPETEEVINPRIPTTNLIATKVQDQMLMIDQISIELPKALKLENGEYNVLIPVKKIKLNNELGVKVTINKVEQIENKQIVSVLLGNNILFVEYDEKINKEKEWYIEIDFPSIKFYQGNVLIQDSITEYDKINGMFLNHITAKQFIGNKYDHLIEERVREVEEKYQKINLSLNEKANDEINNIINGAPTINSKEINAKNKPLIEEKKKEMKRKIAELKKDLNRDLQELISSHKEKNIKIMMEVKDNYNRIYQEELESFNGFKEINQDQDAYRKRLVEFRHFKVNHQLECDNEINKRLNVETIEFDTMINSLKGNFRREQDELINSFKEFKNQCFDEAYPLKKVEKAYNEKTNQLKKEYSEALTRAKIIFFFKTGNLLTLVSDEIANKMIQSLGIKVLTKQYIIEIPHDAYQITNDGEGIKVTVEEVLDYGTTKYAKCLYKEFKNQIYIYINLNNIQTSTISKELIVKYDINRIHVIEKTMDIRIH